MVSVLSTSTCEIGSLPEKLSDYGSGGEDRDRRESFIAAAGAACGRGHGP